MLPSARARTRAASVGLLTIAGLHVTWATGASWPASDRTNLTDLVAGRPAGRFPGPAACLAVAGLLGTAAAFVEGKPQRAPTLSRVGATGVVAVLTTRGMLGLVGRTDLVSPGSDSERFRRRDRQFYAPLCLGLAVLSLPAVVDRPGRLP
jgi:hypothetical protein